MGLILSSLKINSILKRNLRILKSFKKKNFIHSLKKSLKDFNN